MTNLGKLFKASKDLTVDERNRLDNFFIGALSVSVDAETWNRCLDLAIEACARAYPKEDGMTKLEEV